MKIKLIQYALAGAAAGIVLYLFRKKLTEHKKNTLQQKFVEDFSYQRRKRYKDYYGDYTL